MSSADEAGTTTETSLARRLLEAFVQVATGNDAALPRAGQAQLHEDILDAIELGEALVGQAPTGSGKSAALLSAAIAAAVEDDKRTVISTDSLALMSQFQGKDVPTALAALGRVMPGTSVRIEFMKGVSNYVDPAAVIAAGRSLTGTSGRFEELAEQVEAIPAGTPIPMDYRFADDDRAPETFRALVAWGLRQYLDRDAEGSRHSCPLPGVTESMWAAISSSADRADDGTRFGVTSKSSRARAAAWDADIIVTNHALLAVQAAIGIPVLIGNAKFGEIDQLFIDEAHALPQRVRDQGAKSVSAETLRRAARSVFRAAGSPSGSRQWVEDAERIGDELNRDLRDFLGSSSGETRRMTPEDNPIAGVSGLVARWVEIGQNLLKPHASQDADLSRAQRAKAALESLSNIADSMKGLAIHRSGWARWVERSKGRDASITFAASISPIDVGFLLRDHLYSVPDEYGDPIELSVVAVSATMPGNAAHQLGLGHRVSRLSHYPTPFDGAYGASALFIPLADAETLPRITSTRYGNRPSFDTKLHAEFAAEIIVRLVRANAGSALVLSATAESGRLYAEELRAKLANIETLSQWDGGSTQRIVERWRDDIGSVLVGTRSMMTGVDAPGVTNTLVIVDRVPRSPGNPVDDARAEQAAERADGDRWTGDRAVYVTDAALLLQQAIGRLVRSETDLGMVACLDPRLLKRPIAYPELTRGMYMAPLLAFGTKLTDVAAAESWLSAHRR